MNARMKNIAFLWKWIKKISWKMQEMAFTSSWISTILEKILLHHYLSTRAFNAWVKLRNERGVIIDEKCSPRPTDLHLKHSLTFGILWKWRRWSRWELVIINKWVHWCERAVAQGFARFTFIGNWGSPTNTFSIRWRCCRWKKAKQAVLNKTFKTRLRFS